MIKSKQTIRKLVVLNVKSAAELLWMNGCAVVLCKPYITHFIAEMTTGLGINQFYMDIHNGICILTAHN